MIADPFTPQPTSTHPTVGGLCSVCGWETRKLPRGKVPGHFEWRINGLGEPYESRDWCPGGGQDPEVVEP